MSGDVEGWIGGLGLLQSVGELTSALVPVRYSEVSAIRSVRYWEVFKVQYIWEAQLDCLLYGRCPLFGVSAKRGSTVIRMLLFQLCW